jgi:hypothetical protein
MGRCRSATRRSGVLPKYECAQPTSLAVIKPDGEVEFDVALWPREGREEAEAGADRRQANSVR